MDKEIKIGSVVVLKSEMFQGSIMRYMTVEDFDHARNKNHEEQNVYVICVWFMDGEIKKASLHKDSLSCLQ
jgi:hypothetical protein